jgi:hypothetical protein
MLQAASLFNQLLQHFPRTEFASLVKKHLAERAAKGFTCWTQFVAMTFRQLATLILYARSATGWLAVKANGCISASPTRPTNPPCRMPMSTVRRRSSKTCSTPR